MCIRDSYWGAEWNYAKEQCEKNARIEGIADRVTFQKGDAAKLDFADETFDAAVSHFVFHDVHSAKAKRDVVREALRVLKMCIRDRLKGIRTAQKCSDSGRIESSLQGSDEKVSYSDSCLRELY